MILELKPFFKSEQQFKRKLSLIVAMCQWSTEFAILSFSTFSWNFWKIQDFIKKFEHWPLWVLDQKICLKIFFLQRLKISPQMFNLKHKFKLNFKMHNFLGKGLSQVQTSGLLGHGSLIPNYKPQQINRLLFKISDS